MAEIAMIISNGTVHLLSVCFGAIDVCKMNGPQHRIKHILGLPVENLHNYLLPLCVVVRLAFLVCTCKTVVVSSIASPSNF